MVTRGEDSQGNYKARKRLPDDVRDEYSRLYGSRFGVKFFAPASTKPNMAAAIWRVARKRRRQIAAVSEQDFAVSDSEALWPTSADMQEPVRPVVADRDETLQLVPHHGHGGHVTSSGLAIGAAIAIGYKVGNVPTPVFC